MFLLLLVNPKVFWEVHKTISSKVKNYSSSYLIFRYYINKYKFYNSVIINLLINTKTYTMDNFLGLLFHWCYYLRKNSELVFIMSNKKVPGGDSKPEILSRKISEILVFEMNRTICQIRNYLILMQGWRNLLWII